MIVRELTRDLAKSRYFAGDVQIPLDVITPSLIVRNHKGIIGHISVDRDFEIKQEKHHGAS